MASAVVTANPICRVIIDGRHNNKSGEEIIGEIKQIEKYEDHINTKCGEDSFSYSFMEALLNVSKNYDLLKFLIDQGVEEIYKDPKYFLNNPLPFAIYCLHFRIKNIVNQDMFKIRGKLEGYKSEDDIESYIKSNMDTIINMVEFEQYEKVILNLIDIIRKLLEKGHRTSLPKGEKYIFDTKQIELKDHYSYVELYLKAMIQKKYLEQQAPQSQNTAAVAVQETDAKLDAESLKNLYNKLFKDIFPKLELAKGGSRKKRKTTKRKTTKRKTTKRKITKRKTTKRKLSKKKSSKRKPTKK